MEPVIGQTESKVGKADSTKLGKVAQDYYSYDAYRSINSTADYLRVDNFPSFQLHTFQLAINPDQQLVWHFRPKFYSGSTTTGVQIRVAVTAWNSNCNGGYSWYYSPWTTISSGSGWKYGNWSTDYDLNANCNGTVHNAIVEIQAPSGIFSARQVSIDFVGIPAALAGKWSPSEDLDLSKPATETALPEQAGGVLQRGPKP